MGFWDWKRLFQPSARPVNARGAAIRGRFAVAKPFTLRIDGDRVVLDHGDGVLADLPILGQYAAGHSYAITDRNALAVREAHDAGLCLITATAESGLEIGR